MIGKNCPLCPGQGIRGRHCFIALVDRPLVFIEKRDISVNQSVSLAISADSHISETEDCFADIDPAFAERRPRAVFDEQRGALLAIEDLGIKGPMGIICTAGRSPEDFGKAVDWNELHPAGHQSEARLAIQDEEGIAAEVLYPSLGLVLCNHPDIDFQKGVLRCLQSLAGKVL